MPDVKDQANVPIAKNVDNRQLSPRGAVCMGLVFVASGILPILFGLGILTPSRGADPPPPGWVPVACGLMFMLAGLAVILDYAIAGGMGPDGDFKPGTPLLIRGANLLLGLGIVGMMTAVFGWVAFGSGPRTFSSTISLPFDWRHSADTGELSGRLVFGCATVLLAFMFVACGIVGVRRFARAWRGQ